MAPVPAVLILTSSADHFTVDRVASELKKRGAEAVRFNVDKFPLELQLSVGFGGGRAHCDFSEGHRRVSSEQIAAVWLRRLAPPKPSAELDPRYAESCLRESAATLDGFLDSFSHARWIDPPARVREAQNKLLQLRLATQIGLELPATLVTNDPEAVRRFFSECDGKVVMKMLTPMSQSMGVPERFVYTSEVNEPDLAALDTLRHSPVVFQERVEKRCELRVIFVARQFFVGAIDASRSKEGRIDWRRASPQECAWERAEIPTPVAQQLSELMSRLGLSYGAIDIIRTPSERYIFLEVNPGGEWGMLERDLSYPISSEIAHALLRDLH